MYPVAPVTRHVFGTVASMPMRPVSAGRDPGLASRADGPGPRIAAPARRGGRMATSGTVDDRTEDGRPALRRVMGPGLLLLFIVGDILGTGIYALTGQVAAEVGGVVW